MKLLFVLLLCSAAFGSDFSDEEINYLGNLVESGEAEETTLFIGQYGTVDRIELYNLARELFVFSSFQGQNLDDLAYVSSFAIEDMLSTSREQSSELIRKRLLDQANIFSYNLSADLAQCWPGDTLVRTEEHFQRGLSAALQCIEWRLYLEKNDEAMYMAHWAAGMHQLSLGQPEQAIYNMVRSLNYAEQMAVDSGISLGFYSGAGFKLLLAHGYLGLAFIEAGDSSQHYDETISLFQDGLVEYPGMVGDYQFGIDQLEWARKKLEAGRI